MQSLTRRETLMLAAAGGAAWFTPMLPAQAQGKEVTDLAEAIHAFNTQAATEAPGKSQPPLTKDEVIAAIRWICAVKSEPGITEAEYAALLKVAETGKLTPGAELEVLTSFQPNQEIVITAWSVRLRMPHGPNGGTYAFSLREQKVSSRLIGSEERKVMRKWDKKWQEQGGIASFDRPVYSEERAHAAQMDRSLHAR